MRVSDKVICVEDRFPPEAREVYESLPVTRQIYVIRGSYIAKAAGEEQLQVYLVGIKGLFNSRIGRECSFAAWRFRPLAEVQAENAMRRRKGRPVV